MSADSTPPPPYASPNNAPPNNININNDNGDDNTNQNAAGLYGSSGNASGLYNLFLTAVGAAPDIPPTAGTPSSEDEEVWVVADESNTLAQQQQQQQQLVSTTISDETTVPPPPTSNAVGHHPAATLPVESRFNETNANDHATGGGATVDNFNRDNDVGTGSVSAAGALHLGSGRGGASGEIGTGTPGGNDRDARRRRRRHLVSGGDGSSEERQPQQLPQGRNTSLAASAAAANSQHRLAASGGSQSQQLPAHNNHPPFGSSSGQAGGARGAGRGERRGGLLPSWSSRLIGGGGSRVGEGEAGSNSASSNSRAYGSSNVGSGGGDGGAGDAEDSEVGRDQARILFYHKPTLANVPTGDVPDAVPVYLGCPNGGMALGLPLNESWQGGAQQDTTFNQNLSYTILSWPEQHVKDLLELRRLQVVFLTAMVFNILVAGLLFWVENPDRTRVEPPARAGSFPGPFEQRSASDLTDIAQSQEKHLLAVLLIGLVGIASVSFLNRTGILVYLCLAVMSMILGLGSSPDPLIALRYMVDLVLIIIGRTLLSSLTFSWVTASAGDGSRG